MVKKKKSKTLYYIRRYDPARDKPLFMKGGIYEHPTLERFNHLREIGEKNGWVAQTRYLKDIDFKDYKERHTNTVQAMMAGQYFGTTIEEVIVEYTTMPELTVIKARKQKTLKGFVRWIEGIT